MINIGKRDNYISESGRCNKPNKDSVKCESSPCTCAPAVSWCRLY